MRACRHLLRITPFLLCLVHCNHSIEPTAPNPGTLMPLQVGNSWRYQVWAFVTPFTAKAEITRQVSVTIDGASYEASAYLLPYPIDGQPPPFEWIYWNGPDGLYWLGGIAPTDTLLYKTLLFKYPAQVGEAWPVVRINYDPVYEKFSFFDTVAVSLVSKDETIETPAGKFKCHVYKYRQRPADDVAEKWDYYHYYYPTIGRVAYITRGISDNRIIDRVYLICHYEK